MGTSVVLSNSTSTEKREEIFPDNFLNTFEKAELFSLTKGISSESEEVGRETSAKEKDATTGLTLWVVGVGVGGAKSDATALRFPMACGGRVVSFKTSVMSPWASAKVAASVAVCC